MLVKFLSSSTRCTVWWIKIRPPIIIIVPFYPVIAHRLLADIRSIAGETFTFQLQDSAPALYRARDACSWVYTYFQPTVVMATQQLRPYLGRLRKITQGQLSLPSLGGRWISTSFGWEDKGRYGSFRWWMYSTRGVQVKLWDPLRTRVIPEPNLSGYMCTNYYSNKERFDKVIAKIKWCSFLPNSVCASSADCYTAYQPQVQ